MRTLTIVASPQLFVLKGRTGEIVAVLVVPGIILMMTRMTMVMTLVTSGTKAKNTRTKMNMTIGDDGDDIDDDVGVTMQKLPRQPPVQLERGLTPPPWTTS